MNTTGDHSAPPAGLRSGRPYGGARASGAAWKLAPASLFLVLLCLAAAWADDEPVDKSKPLMPEQAADAVLAAVKAKDEAALKALAVKDDPDPWLVADELCFRGEPGAADAFAKAALRKDTERLPAYVASWRSRPDGVQARERLRRAVEALLRSDAQAALDALGAHPSRDDVVSVQALDALARAQDGVGRSPDSRKTFLAAAESAERLGWIAAAARCLHGSAQAAVAAREPIAARDCWQRRLALEEARTNLAGVADTLICLGSLGFDEARSLSLLERALALCDQLGHPILKARALEQLTRLHLQLGDSEGALARGRQALGLWQEIGSLAGTGRILGLLGEIHRGAGQYAQALEDLGRARSLAESLADREQLAHVLAQMADVYEAMDDLATPRRLLTEALAAHEELGAAARAVLLRRLGRIHLALGGHAEALRVLEEALSAQESVAQDYLVAPVLIDLARAHEALGHLAEALSLLERALVLCEQVGARVHVVRVLAALGRIHAALGHDDEARALVEHAVRLAREMRAKPDLLEALSLLARLRLGRGSAKGALQAATQALADLEDLAAGLHDEAAAGTRAGHADLFDIGALAALAEKDVESVCHFLESGRAIALLESLGGREALRRAVIPEALRKAEAYALARVRRAQVRLAEALTDGQLRAVREARKESAAAREALLTVTARIQREARKQAGLFYPRASTMAEIQEHLRAGEALVLYTLTAEEGLALVVTAKAARGVALGGSAAIVQAAEALVWNDLQVDPSASVERLRDLIVAPLALGEEVTRLIVSPDGVLHRVPFALLAPDLEVMRAPSGTALALMRSARGKRGEGVLALGDPDYGSKAGSAAISPRGRRLAALPGTRAEAKAVGDVVLLRGDATERRWRETLATRERWRAVHLACHGLIDPERPPLSALALTPDAQDDGLLMAVEVLRLEIPADLVVLSADEAGSGRIVKGEGMVGLPRAFLCAGASAVLAPLGRVDDEATRALMVKFYELWNPKDGSRGLGAAAALKEAQAFVKSHEKWGRPYYWAAWVLWGLPE